MTKDDILRMAREAGFVDYELDDYTPSGYDIRYERFAALVAAAEREACAEAALDADDQGSVNQRLMQKRIAAAIRARSVA